MARIRSVKPELRTSLTVAEWPFEVRYFFVLLWGYLDDHGRGVDEARLIRADCFPLDDITTAQVDGWLDLMAGAGTICRYSVGKRRYLHIPEWGDHQKPQHPKATTIPDCPKCYGGAPSGDLHEGLMTPSGEPREDFTPEMEQGDVVVVVGGTGAHPPDAKRATKPRAERATRIPDDFTISGEMRSWALEHAPGVELERETIKFVNYWTAKGGTAATKLDWPRTWQNWILTAAERSPARASPPDESTPDYHQRYVPEGRR